MKPIIPFAPLGFTAAEARDIREATHQNDVALIHRFTKMAGSGYLVPVPPIIASAVKREQERAEDIVRQKLMQS